MNPLPCVFGLMFIFNLYYIKKLRSFDKAIDKTPLPFMISDRKSTQRIITISYNKYLFYPSKY